MSLVAMVTRIWSFICLPVFRPVYIQNMELLMKKSDIICISTHYWNDFWFRKQHFMSRFAKLGHRVLYVQPKTFPKAANTL